MGRVGVVTDFVLKVLNGSKAAEAAVDTGGGERFSSVHFSPPGDDSQPLPGDYAAIIGTQRTGGAAAIGYLDPSNEQEAGPGEKRIYSRGSDASVKASVWLKGDGSVILGNPNMSVSVSAEGAIKAQGPSGSIELTEAGAITADTGGTSPLTLKVGLVSLTIAPDGSVTVTGNAGGVASMTAAGVVTINGVTITQGGALVASTIGAGAFAGAGGAGPVTAQDIEVAGTLDVAGVSVNTHAHPAGALIDAEGRPVTGSTGSMA